MIKKWVLNDKKSIFMISKYPNKMHQDQSLQNNFKHLPDNNLMLNFNKKNKII